MPYELRQGSRTLRVLDDDDLLADIDRAILEAGPRPGGLPEGPRGPEA
jgi:hypothetical protein